MVYVNKNSGLFFKVVTSRSRSAVTDITKEHTANIFRADMRFNRVPNPLHLSPKNEVSISVRS